ncbi:MAG: glutamine--fructose-6-phosphate transaminase (isomerizing) [Deltaproteobacteria bacterium]|nr:glutamine--fructose-6-phosphate transaminase (isomerizing) [Deltaproteobacteria bacterium]
MCGIVGYVGHSDRAQDVIIDGLRRLEYRGYDSAGVAILEGAKLRVIRAQGKLVNLESALRDVPLAGSLGIGHTRWATHGKPSERNAHPHLAGTVAVIGNGIVENFRSLRDELAASGSVFKSETDTEIISHLVYAERKIGKSLVDSVRAALRRLEGSYAIAVVDETVPDQIVIAKNGGNPIVVGIGVGENFVASDIATILPYTRQMQILQDAELAVVTRDGVAITSFEGAPVERPRKLIQWDPVQAEKGGYDRFMQKEIFEQPRAISETIGTRVREDEGDIDLNGIALDETWVRGLAGIQLVACGTAWHAAMIGRAMIERFARIPCDVDLASEYRYREPIVSDRHLVIPVSQSGETADTIAALREAMRRGAKSLAVCNVHESTIARTADHVLYTHAGPEIGVASTKCFTTQVVALSLIALRLALLRGALSHEQVRQAAQELRRLPRLVEETLGLWSHVEGIARRHMHARDFLFLGRGYGFPVALEGALKLKEISYIHAEGYASGEMKHGPIALIDENVPVVIVANQRSVYGKLISNAEEARARGGIVIAIVEAGNSEAESFANEVIRVPETSFEPLSAVIATIPLQMLAYHVATLKGTDVDQPRNLAKSVTVE